MTDEDGKIESAYPSEFCKLNMSHIVMMNQVVDQKKGRAGESGRDPSDMELDFARTNGFVSQQQENKTSEVKERTEVGRANIKH